MAKAIAKKGEVALREGNLLADVREMILAAREHLARQVDAGLVTLYWSLGRRIRQDVLQEKRAEYGEQIVSAMGRQLEAEFGRGFGKRNLFRMIRFAEAFPDFKIVSALMTQLGWTHFLHIIPMDDPLKRDFYAGMCRVERWSTRTLEKKIQSMLFERTALSRQPDTLIEQEVTALREEDKLTPDLVFRDPYLLGFLGLKDTYAEKDLEAAILREMEAFILELGVGFAFLERQKRVTVDGDDYYLDLLFFHRRLRRLVAIELKIGDFRPGDKGQMELYLRWLDKYERQKDEESPIGLILCAGKKEETVRLLDLEASGIRVASYWTEALPREQLQRKLHEAVYLARERLQASADDPAPKGQEDQPGRHRLRQLDDRDKGPGVGGGRPRWMRRFASGASASPKRLGARGATSALTRPTSMHASQRRSPISRVRHHDTRAARRAGAPLGLKTRASLGDLVSFANLASWRENGSLRR